MRLHQRRGIDNAGAAEQRGIVVHQQDVSVDASRTIVLRATMRPSLC
jgi:hypothetical protein